RQAPVGYFFRVVTQGYGAMPDYAAQIAPADRWAVVGYIRALQLSQNARLEDVPPDPRQKLKQEERHQQREQYLLRPHGWPGPAYGLRRGRRGSRARCARGPVLARAVFSLLSRGLHRLAGSACRLPCAYDGTSSDGRAVGRRLARCLASSAGNASL